MKRIIVSLAFSLCMNFNCFAVDIITSKSKDEIADLYSVLSLFLQIDNTLNGEERYLVYVHIDSIATKELLYDLGITRDSLLRAMNSNKSGRGNLWDYYSSEDKALIEFMTKQNSITYQTFGQRFSRVIVK